MPTATNATTAYEVEDHPTQTRGIDEDTELDRSLVERVQQGDRDAYAMLYRRHVASVYALAYRNSGSKEVAEEVTSATFERALRSISQFSWKGGGIRPWFLRIASTETSAWYRREQRSTKPRAQMIMRELALGSHGSHGSHPAEEPGDTTFGIAPSHIRNALADLHPRYQQAISLRYLASFSAEDTAVAMGCSKSVLAVTLHRAISALRKALANVEVNRDPNIEPNGSGS